MAHTNSSCGAGRALALGKGWPLGETREAYAGLSAGNEELNENAAGSQCRPDPGLEDINGRRR